MNAGAQRVVEDPTLRQRFSFRRETDESGDEVLLVEVWVDPGGGVTPHVHPSMEERFEVLEGQTSFLAGTEWTTAGPGEAVVVPAGTRHAYRNKSSEPSHFVCYARPPSTLQEFLEDAAALGRARLITPRMAIPKTPRALLAGAVMVERYKDMVVLGFPPMPPGFLQRILFPPLARMGERRGIKVGHFAETL